MIFRGDGKNNIVEGNCFSKFLGLTARRDMRIARYVSSQSDNPPITKVLMNPPFALKHSDEKEYKFINHALTQMEDGGLLFCVLAYPVLVKGGQYLKWRKELLRKNMLLSVITFPGDLFYPIGVHTVGIFIKKGVPHPDNQNVLWVRALKDGYVKSKGKRLLNNRERDDLDRIKDILNIFLVNPSFRAENIKEFQKASPIDFDDKSLELVPEPYLDAERPSIEEIEEELDKTIRKFISFMIMEKKHDDFKEIITDRTFSSLRTVQPSQFKEVPITDIFRTPIDTGEYHASNKLDEGSIPLISCSSENEGLEGNFDLPIGHAYKSAITISSDGKPLTSFYHYYPFSAKDNVILGFPKEEYRLTTLIFIANQINELQWRFSYGRKCYLNKIHKIKIFLPMKNSNIDEDYIEYLVKKCPAWDILKKVFLEND